MSKLHLAIQKILMFGFALCFMFVSVYIPQPLNKVPQAEAGMDAKESTQWLNRGLLTLVNVAVTASQAILGNLYVKQYILDPLEWFAKNVLLALITNSLVRWINSGFQGEPSFVQDIERYLLRMADNLFSDFVHNIGVAPFVCRPFRLNIQVALAQSYRYSRAFLPRGTSYCSISGAVANIDNFVSGSFNDGGWDAWYRVSLQPNTYTPYGSYMSARNEVAGRLVNAQRNESSLIGYGSGHRSKKLCTYVPSVGGTHNLRCVIATPGHVISEALNFQLSVGQRTLIVADEFKESIGAIMAALTNQALIGTAGLLGLSGGTGYTDYSYGPNNNTTAIDHLVQETKEKQSLVTESIAEIVYEQLQKEDVYLTKAVAYREQMLRLSPMFDVEANYIQNTLVPEIIKTKNDIDALIAEVNADPSQLQSAFTRYNNLHLHTDAEIQANDEKWFNMFNSMFNESLAILLEYKEKSVFYEKELRDAGHDNDADDIKNGDIPAVDAQINTLKKISDDYITNKNTDPLAGAKAVKAYLDIRGTLFTQGHVDSRIDYWESLL